MDAERTIREYFDAWLTKSDACLTEIFTSDAVYSECYGPEYQGLEQITRWFHDWNSVGSVTQWEITRFFQCGPNVAVEWKFACYYQGENGAFNGVTIAELDPEGKIRALREYESKAAHVFPYRKSSEEDGNIR